ncbi:MAG TPA: LuxR family transcriptional regulator [Mycobacterium sp.]|jgi:DNA-binding CsgD family transcriptional regulator|nr:LuxR family transcriptional regulator [Micromonosporaceae bacterium]
MVGRDAELRQVREVVSAARAGTSKVLVIRGEPGIGKTHLLSHANSHADGLDVHYARAVESENIISFALVSMIIRPLAAYIPALPAVQRRALHAALGQDDATGCEPAHLGAAMLGLLTESGRDRPRLLLVDDVHWADDTSVQALMFALRRLNHDPVGALIALRDVDTPLVAGYGLPTLDVTPLDADSIQDLVAATTGRPIPIDVAEGLALATGGNPLAIVELARTLDDTALRGRTPLPDPLPIADGLLTAFATRARSLPRSTVRALVITACSDEQLGSVADALVASGGDIGHLEPAERSGLVEVSGGRVAFVHPLMRTAVLADCTAADRRAAHRALASSDRISLEVRAWHLAHAAHGVDSGAVRQLRAAAESAASRGDHSAAADLWETASGLSPNGAGRTELLIKAADAMRHAGHRERTVSLVEMALRQPVDARTRGQLLALRAGLDIDPVVNHETALVAAALLSPHDVHASVRALHTAMFAGVDARAADLVQDAAHRALALDVARDPHAAYERDSLVAVALAITGRLPDAVPLFTNVLAMIERDDELRTEPAAVLQAVIAAGFLGLTESAAALANAARVSARRLGRLSIVPMLASYSAEAAARRGDWPRASALFNEAADLHRAMGDEDGHSATLAYLAEIQVQRGEDDAAEAAASRRLTWAAEHGITRDRPPAVRVTAILEMRSGRPGLALRRLLAEANEPLDGVGVRRGPLTVVADLVDAALLAGTADGARQPVERLSRYAATSPDPLASAIAARCRAQLTLGAEAETQYRSALAHHERDLDSFATACTRLRFGEWLRRAGRRADARDQLYPALDAFDRLQAAPWAVRARGELRSTGETIGHRSESSTRLTPQELRVGMAVAEGITNREVASQLYLSVKTVEYHLGSIFRKLGLTSRAQLARHPQFTPGP